MEKIYTYILLPLLVLVFHGCNAEDDNTINSQQTAFESYLNATSDEWDKVGDVYRYVRQVYGSDIERTNSNRIERGDSVYFRYAAYQFNNRRVEPAFYTNIEELIDELRDNGVNTIFFSREPEKVEIGKSKLIKPIETGLVDCHKGDSVMLFLTKDLAFGANYVMSLPPESAVEYAIIIDEVIKQ